MENSETRFQLRKLTVKELYQIARDYDIPGRSGLRKEELIDLLQDNLSKTKLLQEVRGHSRSLSRRSPQRKNITRSRSPKSGDKVPDNVVDKKLYRKIRNKVKKRVKVWPSAYASGQLVKEYKAAGGKYKGKKKSGDDAPLDRWYKEKWVNVCKPTNGGYQKCGRKKSKVSEYPYCRPSVRVTSKTPMTVSELKKKYGQKKLDKLCEKKQSSGTPKNKKPRKISSK